MFPLFSEPGMLLIMHSLSKYAGVSATLVEFLLLVSQNYDPTHAEQTQKGVLHSLTTMKSKGVVKCGETTVIRVIFADS